MRRRARTSRQFRFDRRDVTLAYHDFDGDGNAIVLLHGLCGGSHEWKMTVDYLATSSRIIAMDLRGHAFSGKAIDYGRDAFVNDVVDLIEAKQLAPVILVGQSMGGLVAMLIAARRPDLVRGLVVIEATPARNAESVDKVRAWLLNVPERFPDRDEALAFFGGATAAAEAWVSGLEKTDNGLVPRFNRQDAIDSMADVATVSYWSEWKNITCPSLLVVGDGGSTPAPVVEEMERLKPELRVVRVRDAGHDCHLDQPASVAAVLDAFLLQVDGARRALGGVAIRQFSDRDSIEDLTDI